MTVKKNIKRSNNAEQRKTQVEGLDLTSNDSEELVTDKGNNKSSPINSGTANLIPELNNFALSPSLTQSSPLLQGNHRQNNNFINDIRQSPLISIQARSHIPHIPIPFVSNYQYHPHFHHLQHPNSHQHRRSNSATHQSVRSMRPVRRSALQFSAQERRELIESNLRRSEVLRRKMQVIEYELFIISRNISKLNE